ncbi:hypothetical protein BCR34DRAFT_244317 [Clohesyomyces aquaticus]|uniref:Uncharacterized protein n=1 Tax=Clohesyomyces aquaticus TaxID=1231657 RepID=A0A1Y1ZUX6_9PLEO|nr:hypothetical protein BCR34DRAFT_244317 [Clohesyomyces aquaticus]
MDFQNILYPCSSRITVLGWINFQPGPPELVFTGHQKQKVVPTNPSHNCTSRACLDSQFLTHHHCQTTLNPSYNIHHLKCPTTLDPTPQNPADMHQVTPQRTKKHTRSSRNCLPTMRLRCVGWGSTLNKSPQPKQWRKRERGGVHVQRRRAKRMRMREREWEKRRTMTIHPHSHIKPVVDVVNS